ncbi:MAG: hypothetical protein C0501_02665 [Isosphaera sp.]|nr:hypothetical protein [Isosphaera sp.]
MPDAPPTDDRPLLPPEDSFDEKYNSRLEFPLATVGAVLIHVLIAAVLVYVLAYLMKGENRGSVDVRPMAVNGLDDFGDGSSGSGGVPEPLAVANGDPVKAAVDSLPDPTKLPEIREKMQQTIRTIDPSGNLPISDANAAAYASLDEAVRNKLIGARQGSGNEKGTGFDGSKGAGPGGTGANSTLGRNMRWTLRFKVTSGRDYLDQLRAMGAKILIPKPGTGQVLLIESLNAPDSRRVVSADQLGAYAGLMQFHDVRRDVVNSVAETLKLDFAPTSFCAVFSKEQENELARMETAYRNRRAEDIELTVFRVTVRGDRPEVVVDEQKAKR